MPLLSNFCVLASSIFVDLRTLAAVRWGGYASRKVFVLNCVILYNFITALA